MASLEKKNVIIPNRPIDYRETFSLYMILVKKRDELTSYLKKKGVETKIVGIIKSLKILRFKVSFFVIFNIEGMEF